MAWLDRPLQELASEPCCGYRHGSSIAAEPTSMAAIALSSRANWESARRAADWLASHQAADGSVAVREGANWPVWTTPLALLAWQSLASHDKTLYRSNVERAGQWILQAKSESASESGVTGHDTRLTAWPWVVGTHAWVEPTSMAVLALKSCGYAKHARTREAVRLLVDRLLPDGGCNYGNTTVLGRMLRPHVQPTGLAVLALTGEPDAKNAIARSVDFLSRNVSGETTAQSLAWALIGLTAYGRRPAEADQWLNETAARGSSFDGGPLRNALLLLAAQQKDCLLISMPCT
jgi:hypothetical protein